MPCCNYSKRVFRIGCVLIIYYLPSGSSFSVASLTARSSYQLKPWIFGRPVYNNLKEMHKEFSVFNHDLYIKCTKRQIFKNYDITAAPNCLLRRSTPQIQKKIIDEAVPIIENMKNYIAADLTNDEIEELIKETQSDVQQLIRAQQMRERQQLQGQQLQGPSGGRPARPLPSPGGGADDDEFFAALSEGR